MSYKCRIMCIVRHIEIIIKRYKVSSFVLNEHAGRLSRSYEIIKIYKNYMKL